MAEFDTLTDKKKPAKLMAEWFETSDRGDIDAPAEIYSQKAALIAGRVPE